MNDLSTEYGLEGSITFYGPSEKGFWSDSFEIGERYTSEIFELCNKQFPEDFLSIINSWTDLAGWWGLDEQTELSKDDSLTMIRVLSKLRKNDFENSKSYTCSQEIVEFITQRLKLKQNIYIEVN
jgi:hypothetical protein